MASARSLRWDLDNSPLPDFLVFLVRSVSAWPWETIAISEENMIATTWRIFLKFVIGVHLISISCLPALAALSIWKLCPI